MTITKLTFHLDSNGVAHITDPGLVTAECGAQATGAEVSEGFPCQRCLALTTERLSAELERSLRYDLVEES